MAIVELLNQDMKQAMKDKDKVKLSVIRMVKASIQNEAINLKKDALSEKEEITVLARELKQRNDSLQEFKEAGREDLVGKLEEEIRILKEYMPEQLSEEELEELVVQTIKEVQAQSKKDMGKVMSALMPKVKGKAEGSKVNQLVQKHL
ncbi:GatB/YqeY domain-containing protein [Gracilibacillus sp. YIM 98692]|uniref:GatB/YqeY domain-containing protein n=1 Tax=Gracilibacillus sp. YIM 98692 TaxID=2663532 RepID=UPI0013D50021|nr:GatB/YqeY domain-containing protein [Gracilibacillus sp. YIM 98692]